VGGDPLTDWEHPLWEQDVDAGLRLVRQAVETHVITSRFALPLLIARKTVWWWRSPMATPPATAARSSTTSPSRP